MTPTTTAGLAQQLPLSLCTREDPELALGRRHTRMQAPGKGCGQTAHGCTPGCAGPCLTIGFRRGVGGVGNPDLRCTNF